MRADGQEDSEPVQVKGLYSGRDDSQHFEGVAIILKKGLEKSMIEWKPVNNRLIKIRLRGKSTLLSNRVMPLQTTTIRMKKTNFMKSYRLCWRKHQDMA